MKRSAKWLIALGWLGVMMALSRQAGAQSLRLSGAISGLLAKLLARLGLSLRAEELDPILRRAAHFAVYFIAAALLYGALAEGSSRPARRSALATLLICAAVAFLDEFQKIYIPGRHCAWSEAALNCAGALAGAALRLLLKPK